MAAKLTITYFASHDMLGLVSEEEYQRFKDELLEAFQQEWPDAGVSIEDDEEAYVDLDGISGQAELDVRDRIDDIVNEVIEGGNWQDEEEELFEEEDLSEEDDEEY
jgi:hypothetical protein